MDREQQADSEGRKVTRAERKTLRIADLREYSAEDRLFIRSKAQRAIQHCKDSFARANANGMNITPEALQKSIASDVLTLECLAEIEAEENDRDRVEANI